MALELSQAKQSISIPVGFLWLKNFETQNFDPIFIWFDRALKVVYTLKFSLRLDEYFYEKFWKKVLSLPKM